MVPASPTKLLSRAAVMAIAATLVPACSSSDPEPQTSDAAGDTFFSMDAAYGGPPDTGTPPDTGNAPLYGGPFDTGATDSASSDAADASDASSD